MEVKIICQYCDHKIVKFIYDVKSVSNMVCEKCKDPNLVAKELSSTKVDAYVGCPPFPEKKEEVNPYWT